MKRTILTVLASVLLSGLTAFFVTKFIQPKAVIEKSETGKPARMSVSDYPDFTYAAENCVDAVVYVEVTVRGKQQEALDPILKFFFGDQYSGQGRERIQQGSGSGVIIRPDGYIVTNNHVVAGATQIVVTLNNNETYPATLVGTDPATDVAIIKIEPKTGLQTIEFADSDELRLGEWVLAIGSPMGKELQSTITAGIISAKGRSMPNYTGEFKIESFIQTDAAVNPGNSGGALVTKDGFLAGINTAIVSTTGSYAGYSFAVPANIVRKIADDLIDFGSVHRVKLGVSMSAITPEMAEQYDLTTMEGAYIHAVADGSVASDAGLRSGDIIVAIDGKAIKTPAALQETINGYRPGESITMTICRNRNYMEVQLTFTADNSGEVRRRM